MGVRRRGHARFGPFDLDLDTGELRKHDIKVGLQSQPFEVLVALLESPGELVTREGLKERIWGGETYVDFDQGLNRAIKKIRAALNDSADDPRYVETLAKRGYRFVAQVSFDSEGSGAPQIPPAVEPDPRAGSLVAKKWMQAAAALAIGAVLVVAGLILIRRKPTEAMQGNLRQLTKNAAENSLVNAVISPDGNYLLVGDLAGIHLRSIATQETHTFGRPPEVSAEDGWYPVSWFPDQSRFVAVSESSSSEGLRVKSWIVSVLEGEIHPLRDDAYAKSVSPDGSLIAFTEGGPTLNGEIWVTAASGENARRLVPSDGSTQFIDIQWAPDSRHFADLAGRFSARGSVEYFIESRDLKGSPPAGLVSQEQGFGSVWWPSSGRINYTDFSAGTTLWAISVDPETGRGLGRPRRTANWPGVVMWGTSRSRDEKKTIFTKRSSRTDVYVGELTFNGSLRFPRRLTLEDSENFPWSWTPDSRAVIFTSDRSGSSLVYKQAIDERIAEPIVLEAGDHSEVRVSPDGYSIFYIIDAGDGHPQKAMCAPLPGGPPRLLWESATGFDIQCPRVPSKQCLVSNYVHAEVKFALLNSTGGGLRELFKRDTTIDTFGLGGAAISPDGSEIALLNSDFRGAEIELLSISGHLKQRIGIAGWNRLSSLDYDADGKGFYTGFLGETVSTLLHIDRTGHAEPLWQRPGTKFTWGIASPDGRHLAFLVDGSANNAWMLDGW